MWPEVVMPSSVPNWPTSHMTRPTSWIRRTNGRGGRLAGAFCGGAALPLYPCTPVGFLSLYVLPQDRLFAVYTFHAASGRRQLEPKQSWKIALQTRHDASARYHCPLFAFRNCTWHGLGRPSHVPLMAGYVTGSGTNTLVLALRRLLA